MSTPASPPEVHPVIEVHFVDDPVRWSVVYERFEIRQGFLVVDYHTARGIESDCFPVARIKSFSRYDQKVEP